MLRPPTPDATFRWTTESWGYVLRCKPLESIAQHGFTTRQLALRGGPDTRSAEWAAARMVGGSSDRIARVRQVHGKAVRVLKRGDASAEALLHHPEADAIVSNEPGLALVVLVADCVPILIADPQTGAAAVVHAGWRGTSAGVASAAIDGLRREFGSAPEVLVAAIGPSIGPCCYEVGEELMDAFSRHGHASADVDKWFSRVARDGQGGLSLRLDVARANRDHLIAAGLRPERIFACGLCTRSHSEIFDSYRADGAGAGRMAGIIRVPSAECRVLSAECWVLSAGCWVRQVR